MASPAPASGLSSGCTNPECDKPSDSSNYYQIGGSKTTGGQDWTSVLGHVLCHACYMRYARRGTLARCPDRKKKNPPLPVWFAVKMPLPPLRPCFWAYPRLSPSQGMILPSRLSHCLPHCLLHCPPRCLPDCLPPPPLRPAPSPPRPLSLSAPINIFPLKPAPPPEGHGKALHIRRLHPPDGQQPLHQDRGGPYVWRQRLVSFDRAGRCQAYSCPFHPEGGRLLVGNDVSCTLRLASADTLKRRVSAAWSERLNVWVAASMAGAVRGMLLPVPQQGHPGEVCQHLPVSAFQEEQKAPPARGEEVLIRAVRPALGQREVLQDRSNVKRREPELELAGRQSSMCRVRGTPLYLFAKRPSKGTQPREA